MQVDGNYGILPDTQQQILDNYLAQLQNTFPNANNPDDPVFAIATVNAYFDNLIESALKALWNSKNANTASGLGLDILANTVLNLYRRSLQPSSVVAKFTVQNLLSYVDVVIVVTVASAQTIPSGTTVTGTVTPSPLYATSAAVSIPVSGTYTIRVYSTDITTAVGIGDINAMGAVAGITYTSVTNPGPNVFGSLTIPADWAWSSSVLTTSPTYTPRQAYTYTTNGDKYVLLYSDNLSVSLENGQLNVYTNYQNAKGDNLIAAGGYNPQANMLGKPAESDSQFAARRRYYLNVEGQTYYGIEKAIQNLNVPALQSVFVEEVISTSYTASILLVNVSVTYSGSSVIIPVNWAVTTTPTASPTYQTVQSFTFNASGTYTIPLFSTDNATVIPIGGVTGFTPVTGVTAVANTARNVLDTTIDLGQRGYRVYLEYPTLGAGGGFDINDIYLQQIASVCYEYHPLGTNFYGGVTGSTTFTVNTPYSGYTGSVILSPFQTKEVTCDLVLVYNLSPDDAGFSGGVFTANLATLKEQIRKIINDYFLSKTLPSDLVYTVSELSEIIYNTYTGIVALSSDTVPFTLGTVSPATSGKLWLRREIGYTFHLSDANFNFSSVPK
jgi:hypothetical protein